MHPSREKNALLARYKFIVMNLRKDNARERRNYVTTGGGPRDTNNEKMPFEVTGPLQELANLLGVSITGLDGFGSDTPSLVTDNTSTKDSAATSKSTPFFDTTNDDTSYTFEETVRDHWNDVLNDSNIDAGETTFTGENAESSTITSETEMEYVEESQATSSMQFPGRSQFFPTSSQRRSAKRLASSTALRTSSEGRGSDTQELRKAFITERERRAVEKHAAEMHYEKSVLEAKLEEMRENIKERKAESERRAELHAMTMRHEEAFLSSNAN